MCFLMILLVINEYQDLMPQYILMIIHRVLFEFLDLIQISVFQIMPV